MALQNQESGLSEIQLHLLRFFSERNISEKETDDLRRLIAYYYAYRADALMDKIWEEKGFDEQQMKDILNQVL
jgi:hypothetical protein